MNPLRGGTSKGYAPPTFTRRNSAELRFAMSTTCAPREVMRGSAGLLHCTLGVIHRQIHPYAPSAITDWNKAVAGGCPYRVLHLKHGQTSRRDLWRASVLPSGKGHETVLPRSPCPTPPCVRRPCPLPLASPLGSPSESLGPPRGVPRRADTRHPWPPPGGSMRPTSVSCLAIAPLRRIKWSVTARNSVVSSTNCASKLSRAWICSTEMLTPLSARVVIAWRSSFLPLSKSTRSKEGLLIPKSDSLVDDFDGAGPVCVERSGCQPARMSSG